MRFIETITRELVDLIENLIGPLSLDALGFRSIHEDFALLFHFFLDFLTHGTTQQICATQGITRKFLSDLHDLLLVDHDAKGFLEDWLKCWI